MRLRKELMVSDLLSSEEREELDTLVGTVRHGIESIVEAGKALMMIRDKGLYREQHDTFESFCKDKFSMNKNYAARLVSGYENINSTAKLAHRQESDKEFLQRLRTANHLLKVKAHAEGTPREVIREAMSLIAQATANVHQMKRFVLDL